jgi:hypothetical protein
MAGGSPTHRTRPVRTYPLHVLISELEIDEIRRQARAEEMSISMYIRRIVMPHVRARAAEAQAQGRAQLALK